jgi:predicted nucleotidyltransferase
MLERDELKRGIIYKTIHGSHAYGLNTATSDTDIKGVFIGPLDYYLGFANQHEQIEESTPNDLVIYELRKFFRLAADCNPNIIEVLFTDETEVLECSFLGRMLRDGARAFLSQRAKFTFSGYAHAQLQRIKGHYKWLSNPPKAPPTRAEYGLPDHTLIPKDHLAAAEALVRKTIDGWDINWESFSEADKIRTQAQLQEFLTEIAANSGHGPSGVENMLNEAAGRANHLAPDFIAVLQAEKRFTTAQREWQQYQEWLKNRNPARAALEAKFGYDTKHAMHLVRLMRMGEEILRDGKVLVKRQDREELLDIRNNGIWKYEDLVEWAEKKDQELDIIYKAGTSPLPKSPDRTLLNAWCSSLIQTHHLHTSFR